VPLEKIAGVVVLIGMAAYAVFGGADFGSGIWSALASGDKRDQQREALYRAIGPVWEANNVWLVFAVVFLLMAFPFAFGDIFIALLVPITIGLISVVLRGAAFAFRNFARESGERGASIHGVVFSAASVIAPLFFGIALGTLASGRITLNSSGSVTSGLWSPWGHAFPVLTGVLAVAVCAFLTTSFMTTRVKGELREIFRLRGLLSGVAVGFLGIVTLAVSHWDASGFWSNWLRPWPLAISGAALVAGLGALAVLWMRWYPLSPIATGGAVGTLVGAWGVIMYPYLILPAESIFDAGSNHAMLRDSLIGLLVGAVLLVPSALMLYGMFINAGAESEEESEQGTLHETQPP
jgi:cytochrome d ubiquinol oxidase subunit II